MQVRGKDPQKPIKNWNQCGLSSRVLDVIRKSGFDTPMPIQAQALPVIMSGRDCIGIAETGSGKTLAFVLPMLRHIKDQPPSPAGRWPHSPSRGAHPRARPANQQRYQEVLQGAQHAGRRWFTEARALRIR